MDTQAPGSNVPEYSVSEIAGAVKRTLEGAFGRVRVRGELVEVKRYSSGHTYLCLKDEGGTLRGIIWKTAARTVGLKPEDGIEVIATGRISAYGDKSQYQLIIERLEYAGAGAMLARIEALRVKLAGEGLFERRRAAARAAGRDRGGDLGPGRRAARHPHHDRPPLRPPDPAMAGAGAGRGCGGEDRRRHRRVLRPAAGRACRGRTC